MINKPILVVIGSKALNFHIPKTRSEKDLDVICSYEAFNQYIKSKRVTPLEVYPEQKGGKMIVKWANGDILEAELTWEKSNSKWLYDLVLSDSNSHFNETDVAMEVYPSLNVLYMIKMSHRYLRNSPAFRKTMLDIRLMRLHNATFEPKYLEWFKVREKDTYWYKHPDLTVGKKDFFKPEEVQYSYDHDDIHEAVKQLERPAYTFYMVTGEQVMCDKDKFLALPHHIKLLGVLEESYVLALERHQIPNDFKPSRLQSFLIALSKVCTSITSGWFREFAWEHYDEVVELYDNDYVDKFHNALSLGQVKPF